MAQRAQFLSPRARLAPLLARLVLAATLLALPGCPGPGAAPADASGMDSGPRGDAGPLPDGSRRDASNPIDLSCLNMIPLRLWTTDPSAVAMLYRIETCAGETVSLDPGPGESLFDYYALTENGSSLSSEAVPDIDLSGAQRAYVTLLLDFSSSTRAVEADLLASARAFVDALLGASSRVWVGIEIFDGRRDPVVIQRPTPDLTELRAAIAGLATYSDPLADEGSTNLNGAIRASVADLQARQESVMARNDLGLVTSGYLVAFTDGRDTSGLVTTMAAASAVDTARIATGSSGALANVQTYAVALESSDFTPAARADLVTILGGDERFLYEGSLTALSAEFANLAARIAEQAEATHLLKYCSAARAGSREVELDVLPSIGTTTNSITFTFSADGFAPGCAAFIETICVDRECGGFNCGGCDDRTHACDAASGQCVSECVLADRCSGETITTGLGYELTCDAATLGASVMQCGGVCIDTASDPDHCGSCTEVCETLAGAGERCLAGACTCPGGGEVCSGSCRPPSFFETDNANCGTCGNACITGSTCVAGTCTCPGGEIVCDGACRAPAYFETTSDCGTCNNRCTVTGEVCSAGTCGCAAGDVVCDGACRAPSYFTTTRDCGTCNTTCTAVGETCSAGACSCPSGGMVCAGQCETPSFFTTNLNCGSCGRRCFCGSGACLAVVQVVASGGHSCALLSDGTANCWGLGEDGRLGNGDTGNRLSPTPVTGLVGAIELLATYDNTCARLSDGTVSCWGDNTFGQVGDGTTVDRLTPTVIGSLSNVVELAVSSYHSCARLADGSVRCWGRNDTGQLGDGTSTDRASPVAVIGITNAVELSLGARYSCARLATGSVRCWGENTYGQLGDGTTTTRTSPVAVLGLSGVADIDMGDGAVCARLEDRTARCWGYNAYGLLGDGTTTHRSAPVAVMGLTNVAELTRGCARLTDGTARCWGRNDGGEVGDGTRTPRLSPVPVTGLTNIAELESGFSVCARLTDGTVWCWGEGSSGEVGDGTGLDRLTPTAVLGISDAVDLTIRGSNFAILRDGTLRAWGANGVGQLGVGTISTVRAPVPVP